MDYRVDRNVHSFLDPRTKLLLLFTSSIFVMGKAGSGWMDIFFWILVYIPVVLLALEREWKTCIIASAFYVGSYFAQMALQHDLNALESVLALMLYIISNFLPTIFLARYIVKTTRVSEFISAMQRMHVSDKLIIPISVIFRFFPTILEEYGSIRDAMRMRGIALGGKKASEALEYRMVPLIGACTVIGEELSAAAMTRGLEVGVQRSCIWTIKFGIWDYLLMLFCAACYIWWIIGRFFV
ncbi:MAG: energy-coupling factor transporter transmembrane protein EcfT [Eubacterium sp.]|nr:energy-coupling factor transporter transmembrane protein EcfT [Eubacterium sp.]